MMFDITPIRHRLALLVAVGSQRAALQDGVDGRQSCPADTELRITPSCSYSAIPGIARTFIANRLAVGVAAVALSALFVAFHLHTGWYPHDEGQLGQSAVRILEGELPHRDFDEMYTGVLSYLHALSFQIGGVRSESMRWVLWLFFLPFMSVWYWIVSRVMAPWRAGVMTFLAAAMTLPIYPGSVPSWFNLFFTVFAAACLLKSLDGPVIWWLLAAGVCAGCSILFKVTGIYLVAAGALFLIYREQQTACHAIAMSRSFSSCVTAALAGLAVLSLSFCRRDDLAMSFLHFSAPLAAISALIVWREWTITKGSFSTRIENSVRLQLPFWLGVMLPVALLVLFFELHDALPDLYQGVLVAPRLRLSAAQAPLPSLSKMIGALPLGLIILLGIGPATPHRAIWMCWLVVVVAVSTASAALLGPGTAEIIASLRNSAPFVVGGSLWLLVKRTPSRRDEHPRQDVELFLMVTVAATSGLVQFPFATTTYFFYSAAAVLLCLVYAYRRRRSLENVNISTFGRSWSWLAAAWLAFAVLRLPWFESRFADGHSFPVARCSCHVVNCESHHRGLRDIRNWCWRFTNSHRATNRSTLFPIFQRHISWRSGDNRHDGCMISTNLIVPRTGRTSVPCGNVRTSRSRPSKWIRPFLRSILRSSVKSPHISPE